jgi:hypothetical protein
MKVYNCPCSGQSEAWTVGSALRSAVVATHASDGE